MKTAEFDQDLYLAPVTLWVEDHLTRIFLMELWQDPDIRARAAGGRDGVTYLVKNAPPSLRGKSIVGLVDCDFSPENVDRWRDPETVILRTPAHEFENLLLDFEALARIAGQGSPDELKEKARSHAAQLLWWMTCKQILYEVYLAFTAKFPSPAPAPPAAEAPGDEGAAADHLLSSQFWKEHRRLLDHRWTDADVRRRVRELGASYRAHLAGDDWLRSFSGKEILRFLRSHVPGLRRAAGGTGLSATQHDEDLARKLARVMRGNPSTTVAPLASLRAALRARAGLRHTA
jgi:hypothetical protein